MIPEQTLLNFPLFGDNATKVEPDNNKKSNGWQQADVVPAEWMNWEWYHASKGVSDLNKGVSSMEKEINNVLSSFGITAAEATNNQLLTAVLKLLPKFAECTTAAATEQKAITVTGDVLKAGNVYVIDMTNANTYGDGSSTFPKLVINGGTAYPLCDQDGHYLANGAWAAGDTIKVIFTDAKFLMSTRAVKDVITTGDTSPVNSEAVVDYVSTMAPVNKVEKDEMHGVTSNAVAESLSYSTTEQKTGGKWIDGKDIYRRVINTTVSGGYSTTTNGYYSWETLGFAEMSTFSVSTMIDAFFIGVGAERGDNKINRNCVMVFNRGANYNQAVYQVNSGYDGFKALQLVIEYTKNE